jgi:hypothetical protein
LLIKMQGEYETKKKMLFESLDSAESSLQGSSLEQPRRDHQEYQSFINNQQRKRNRDEYTEKYKRKDSLFKRPDLPIQKCLRTRRRPDYEVSVWRLLWIYFFIQFNFRKIQTAGSITHCRTSPTPQIV